MNIAHTASSTVAHIADFRGTVQPGHNTRSLCGAKVQLTEQVAATAAGIQQPVGTCRRCAAVLGQTVRTLPSIRTGA